jgi:hypothetical protein
MKKILLILTSAICLNACQSTQKPPESFTAEQCQTFLSIDSSGDVDVSLSFCRCRSYTVSRDFIGSRGAVIRKPLSACHEHVGYSVRDNTKFANFLESVRVRINEAESELQKGIFGEIEEPIMPSRDGREHEAGEAN